MKKRRMRKKTKLLAVQCPECITALSEKVDELRSPGRPHSIDKIFIVQAPQKHFSIGNHLPDVVNILQKRGKRVALLTDTQKLNHA